MEFYSRREAKEGARDKRGSVIRELEEEMWDKATFRQGECQLSAKEKCTYLWVFRIGEGNDARNGLCAPVEGAPPKDAPSKLACHFPKGVARLVSHCARPTRGVFDRALREHRRLMGSPSHILRVHLP